MEGIMASTCVGLDLGQAAEAPELLRELIELDREEILARDDAQNHVCNLLDARCAAGQCSKRRNGTKW